MSRSEKNFINYSYDLSISFFIMLESFFRKEQQKPFSQNNDNNILFFKSCSLCQSTYVYRNVTQIPKFKFSYGGIQRLDVDSESLSDTRMDEKMYYALRMEQKRNCSLRMEQRRNFPLDKDRKLNCSLPRILDLRNSLTTNPRFREQRRGDCSCCGSAPTVDVIQGWRRLELPHHLHGQVYTQLPQMKPMLVVSSLITHSDILLLKVLIDIIVRLKG